MRVLNLGSLNIDYVYSVDHIILPGETEATGSRNTFLGGKGMNQSCALAKAGVEVYHGGMIGEDGKMFLDACKEYGVHDEFIKIVDGPSGHTVIQIDKNAQNSILLYGGANQKLTTKVAYTNTADKSVDQPEFKNSYTPDETNFEIGVNKTLTNGNNNSDTRTFTFLLLDNEKHYDKKHQPYGV